MMAKYLITHTCGHKETVQIYGTNVHDEREKRAAWLEQQPCLECRNAAMNVAAKVANAQAGLPALTGTEKQVAWAESIRAKMLNQIAAWMEETTGAERRGGATEEQIAQSVAEAQGYVAKLTSQTSAAWWIDHRSDMGPTLLRKMYLGAVNA